MVKFNAFWQRATRFTLRSLLLVTVFACFAFAWFAHHYRNYQTELRFLADLTKIQNDKTVDLGQPNDLGAFTLAAFNNATDG